MRMWFMVAAVTLGLIGWWGGQGTGRGVRGDGGGTVSTMDDPNPFPTPNPH